MTPWEYSSAIPERAVSQGYLVPLRDFAGTVHSAFKTAYNISMGGGLITVHDSRIPHTPASIRVKTTSSVPWSSRVSVGQAVTVSNGRLRVAGTSLDVSDLHIWRPQDRRRQMQVNSLTLRELEEVRDREATAAEWSGDLRCAVERLRTALNSAKLSLPELASAVGALIGFGPGLTPSGDDVLVGVLAGLDRGGAQSPRSYHAARTIANTIEVGALRTNDISGHYLQLAADGHFGEALTNLVDSAAEGAARPELDRRAQIVLSVGASSGRDTLSGALLGLEVHVDRHEHIHPEVPSRSAA